MHIITEINNLLYEYQLRASTAENIIEANSYREMVEKLEKLESTYSEQQQQVKNNLAFMIVTEPTAASMIACILYAVTKNEATGINPILEEAKLPPLPPEALEDVQELFAEIAQAITFEINAFEQRKVQQN